MSDYLEIENRNNLYIFQSDMPLPAEKFEKLRQKIKQEISEGCVLLPVCVNYKGVIEFKSEKEAIEFKGGKAIEIEPIKFPTLEELKRDYGVWSILGTFRLAINAKGNITANSISIQEKTVQNEVELYTEKNYKQACEWIEETRAELIKKLAQG